MKDKELRKLIGSRAKQRRVELGLNQPYVAEKMGVATSTIVRYEAGTIDNTKKLVLEGLSETLHVSVEWLKGETEEYETDNAENVALAQTMGFKSNKEYNEIMFLREITHTVNMFNDMGDIVRLYSKNPETATTRLANLLSMVSGEESESV